MKKLLTLALAAVMLFALLAPASAEQSEIKGKVRVLLAGFELDDTMDPVTLRELEGLISFYNRTFKTKFPNIEIEFSSVPWSSAQQKQQAELVAGNVDVLYTGSYVGQYFEQGLIRPIDDLIANDKELVLYDVFPEGIMRTSYEMLDWDGRPLHPDDPSNFRTYMDKNFYDPIDKNLAVPEENRLYLTPDNYLQIAKRIEDTEIDYTLGGIGQDGHLAFNQAKRNPYRPVTLEEMRQSTARIQDNNFDTMIALAQRAYGTAWQFQPAMSITLGAKECMKAKKVRIYSATGAWKQTALRVALFSEPTTEYPVTLLSEHKDARITVTVETSKHPFSENPQWRFRGVNA